MAKVVGKCEPRQVRRECPGCRFINLRPEAREVGRRAGQGNDVDGREDRALVPEKERGPNPVETQLDGVNGRCVLCKYNLVRIEAGHADCPSSVGACGRPMSVFSPSENCLLYKPGISSAVYLP